MTQPRRHHYVPRMYLAHFTDTGTKEGSLWAADFNRHRHWRCTPDGVAHSRDFYRVDIPDTDPMVVENSFAELEGEIATVIRNVLANKSFASDEEKSLLLNFVALQLMKTPTMRERFAKPTVEIAERLMDMLLESPEIYYANVKAAKKAGYNLGDKEVSYEEMKACHERKGMIVSTSQNWDIKTALSMADEVLPMLHARNWALIVPKDSDDLFICSDNPVVVHWRKEEMMQHPVGLGLSGTGVYIPLSSQVALLGTFEELPPIIVADTKCVASYNTLTLMSASEQIYSRDVNFKIINSTGVVNEIGVAELAADPHIVLTKGT